MRFSRRDEASHNERECNKGFGSIQRQPRARAEWHSNQRARDHALGSLGGCRHAATAAVIAVAALAEPSGRVSLALDPLRESAPGIDSDVAKLGDLIGLPPAPCASCGGEPKPANAGGSGGRPAGPLPRGGG